jgi:uncharacterized membrane protein
MPKQKHIIKLDTDISFEDAMKAIVSAPVSEVDKAMEAEMSEQNNYDNDVSDTENEPSESV